MEELVLLGGSPSPSDDINLSACFRQSQRQARRGMGSSFVVIVVGGGEAEAGSKGLRLYHHGHGSSDPNLNFVFEDGDVNSESKIFQNKCQDSIKNYHDDFLKKKNKSGQNVFTYA